MITSAVDVKFLVPGTGTIVERYNLLSMYDVMCWKLNASPSRTKAIQLSIDVAEEIEDNEDNLYALMWERAWAENMIKDKAYGEAS